jgi:CheY-like chemotaxis protein
MSRGGPQAALVVESDSIVRTLVAGLLSESGYDVVQAGDGRAGLVLLEARQDVTVLFTSGDSFRSPDGYGLAHLVHRRWPSVAIVVSGIARPTAAERLPQSARFLREPYTPTALLEEIRAAQQALLLVRSSCLDASTLMARRLPATG